MELTMELVEVDSSLELWTLEGNQEVYFFSGYSLWESECFPLPPLRSCQL